MVQNRGWMVQNRGWMVQLNVLCTILKGANLAWVFEWCNIFEWCKYLCLNGANLFFWMVQILLSESCFIGSAFNSSCMQITDCTQCYSAINNKQASQDCPRGYSFNSTCMQITDCTQCYSAINNKQASQDCPRGYSFNSTCTQIQSRADDSRGKSKAIIDSSLNSKSRGFAFISWTTMMRKKASRAERMSRVCSTRWTTMRWPRPVAVMCWVSGGWRGAELEVLQYMPRIAPFKSVFAPFRYMFAPFRQSFPPVNHVFAPFNLILHHSTGICTIQMVQYMVQKGVEIY